ncbi:MAG: OmpA family protein [Peptostreptococcaceae bacterium]
MTSKYTRTINKEVEKSNFWPTFTDLICSVLMVVMLLLFSVESMKGAVLSDLAEKITNSVKENIDINELDVRIDQTNGMVTFGESTMFDLDSAELKEEAKILLDEFIPIYVDTLYKDYGDNIEKIVIKGHTDDSGSYLYNLDLSQQRALSFAKYIVSDEIGDYKYKERVLLDIEAIGRSEAELIKYEDGTINKGASRRVEIKYELDVD